MTTLFEMVLVEEKKAIFIHIPHAAGTSMKLLLENHFDIEKINGVHAGFDAVSDKFEKYFKFCIVRNHRDWILSKWCYLIGRQGELNPQIYNFITDTANSFTDFVVWYLSGGDPKLPQFSGFFNWGGENMEKVDKFIKLDENSFDGMSEVSKRLEIEDYNFRQANQNHSITRKAIYDRSSKELVKKHYQREIDFFDFEF